MKNPIPKSQGFFTAILLVLPSLLAIIVAINLSLVIKPVTASPDNPSSNLHWSSAFAITNNVNGASFPVVDAAPDGKTVLIIYNQNMDITASNIDPYYRKSIDNGATWTPPIAIANTAAKSQHIQFSFDKNSVAHAVWWEGNSLVYANSNNWSLRKTISTVSTSDSISQLSIATSGNNTIDVAWSQGNPELNIYHARSVNGGVDWLINGFVKPTGFISQYPSIGVDSSGAIHIIWQENDNTATITDPDEPRLGGTIYYVKSTNIGTNSVTWSNQVEVSNVVDAKEPEIIIDGTSVHVTYTEYNKVTEQYIQYTKCASQCTQSNNWVQPIRIYDQLLGSNSKPVNLVSSLAQRGNCIISYFHGIHPDNFDENSDLEYIYGDSSCSGWNSVDASLLVDGIQTIYPSIAVHNNWWLYLTYEQGDGNNQIYFHRSKPNLYLPIVFK